MLHQTPLLISAGETLTYKVTLVVPTGDTENLVFTDYLPTPIFSAPDPDDDGTNENTLAQIAQGDAAPSAGEWRFTSASTLTPVAAVTSNSADNSISFDFGDLVEGRRCELLADN